ncbi:DNA-directed DNA polymerase II small subunit [Candidatus Woesearchaeota archaeon]|nr:DNA-directed DNA polymerase II small subunit [Candidatus Woesearchaeota archaeon]
MQELEIKKKDIVSFFLKKGLLLSSELLKQLDNDKFLWEIQNLIEKTEHNEIIVLNKKISELLSQSGPASLNWQELEKYEAISQKKGKPGYGDVASFLQEKPLEEDEEYKLKVIFSYKSEPKKREAQDFIDYFTVRFKSIEKILKQRQELQSTMSISRLFNKKDREQIAVIGMVRDKQQTKNGNYMLTIEDDTAYTKVMVSRSKQLLFNIAKDIVMDEVIGVVGVNGENIIFANNLIYPDVPSTREITKCDDETHAIFLSDLHVGSKYFLEEDFSRFLKWINQDLGNEGQRYIASKVKYIFIVGDLVDGCGIYPDQEKELAIKDIKDQYKECAELLGKIPQHIKLILCPGNHDAMRVAEPQFPIYRDFAEPIYNLPNATIISNPSFVNIHSSKNFPGFDVLLYHGYSFDYYFAEVESIRASGGYDRADLVMKFLLQKRHLAPAHTSTLYVPDTKSDSLFINKVPDFFISGHIHKAAAANYRNTTLISGSCWQSKTAYQEKVGHHPEPSRVPIVNLQTRQVKMLKFGK